MLLAPIAGGVVGRKSATLNVDAVDHQQETVANGQIRLRLIENHARYTGSKRAQELLDKWPQYRARFVKVFPKEYRRALAEMAATRKKAAA